MSGLLVESIYGFVFRVTSWTVPAWNGSFEWVRALGRGPGLDLM